MKRSKHAALMVVDNKLAIVVVTKKLTNERQMFVLDVDAAKFFAQTVDKMYTSKLDRSQNFDLCTCAKYDGLIRNNRVHLLIANLSASSSQVEQLKEDNTTIVHHKNYCHHDNRIENLEVMPRGFHTRLHAEMRQNGVQSMQVEKVLSNLYGEQYTEVFMANVGLLCGKFLHKRGMALVVGESVFQTRFDKDSVEECIITYFK